MAQKHIKNQALSLTARYTVKRMNLYRRPATTQQLSRKELILDINSTTASSEIEVGDLVEVEIMLPVLPGLPERHIYCRCHVIEIAPDATGTHVALEIDTIRIRGEEFVCPGNTPSNLLM
jgi:hypothetical protein